MLLSRWRYSKAVFTLLFFLSLSFRSHSQDSTGAPAQKIKVYLVGTYHFDGAAGDVYQSARQDMKTEDKQRQLDELARRLAKAAPDKIFVEWTPSRQGYLDTTYQLYLRNQFDLGNSEVYQVGYRLGKLLGRKRIYCADAGGGFTEDSLAAYAAQHHQADILTDLNHPKDSVARLISQRIAAIYAYYRSPPVHNLADVILANNTREVIAAAADLYNLVYARIGEGEEYPGADLTSDIYRRNMRIFANILRQTDVIHDRAILVYIGSGHISFLKQIFSSSLLFEVEDVVPLLKGD
jgi:hypothetical protein